MINKFSIKIFLLIILTAPIFTARNISSQNRENPNPLRLKKVVKTLSVRNRQFFRTELYFGMSKPTGEVSEEEFDDFLNRIITKEFPEGLTVLNGFGQFKAADNTIIKEKSRILILFYSAKNQKEINRKIEFIRTAYKSRFQQQSVLRVDSLQFIKFSF